MHLTRRNAVALTAGDTAALIGLRPMPGFGDG